MGGGCSREQDHGKDCKSVVGLGAPRTALNPFVEWPPALNITSPYGLWVEAVEEPSGVPEA